MNVFRREFWSRRIALIAWCVSMILFVWTSMVKFQTLTADTSATSQLLQSMPDTIKTIFGMNGLDAVTLPGYFGICFLFIAIMLAVHAGLLGSSLLTVEPLTKTSEFLYTRPTSRWRIVRAKYAVGILHLIALWIATAASSYVSITLYASMHGFGRLLMVFMAAAAIIQIVFFALGISTAACAASAQTPARVVAMLVFASYALSLVSHLAGYELLRFASIFRAFDAVAIVASSTLSVRYVAMYTCLAVLLLVSGTGYFLRRDLHS